MTTTSLDNTERKLGALAAAVREANIQPTDKSYDVALRINRILRDYGWKLIRTPKPKTLCEVLTQQAD